MHSALRPRAQRLLVYLLLHRKNPIPRKTLAFSLWPDMAEVDSFGMLRRALSDLRIGLPDGEEWVLTTRERVMWNSSASLWLDAEIFEDQIHEGDSESLLQAIELYTGDLLRDMDEEWLIPERERYRQMQFQALRKLARHYHSLQNYSAALEYTRRALLLDPLSELVYQDRIKILFFSGDRAAALAEYERLQSMLEKELGVEPMEETRALVEAMKRGESLASMESVSNFPSSIFQIPPKLFGREEQVGKLKNLCENTALRNGSLAIVSGEAGIGKSQLIRNLAFHVSQRGGYPLIGHCYEFENTLPYQPILEALRPAAHLLQSLALSSLHRAALARLLPELFEIDAIPKMEFSPDELRIQLFEALLQSFILLAQRQPVLLLIEDMHWASESVLDWLTFVKPRLQNNRMLVVVTFRTDEINTQYALPRLMRRLEREDVAITIPLQPLTLDVTREWVIHLSALDQAKAFEVGDRLFRETSGNPFFLQEIVRGMLETGQIRIEEGKWSGTFVQGVEEADIPLPDSLRETIVARTERLSEIARTFLQVAATAGRMFQYDIVLRAGGWIEESALDALDDLRARGFLRESEPHGVLMFAHHLMQEAIYAGLTTPRRMFWHRKLAHATETLKPNDYETLAYHFSRAGNDEVACEYYLRAGDRARELIALYEAAKFYRAALERWPEADPAGRADLLHKYGLCLWVLMEQKSALDAFQEAHRLFKVLNNKTMTGEMQRLMGRMCWELGDRKKAWTHLRQALTILTAIPESIELARSISYISQMHMLASEYREAIARGEEALEIAKRIGAEDVIVHSLNNLGVAIAGLPGVDAEQGLSMLRESLQRALDLGLPHDVCRAYMNLSDVLMWLARYDEARDTYEELYRYADRVNARAFIDGSPLLITNVDWICGRWADALARKPYIKQVTKGPWPVWTQTRLGWMENDLGRPHEALQSLESSHAQALVWKDLQTIAPYLGQLARAYLEINLIEQGEAELNKAFELMDKNEFLHADCARLILIACHWYTSPARNVPSSAQGCLHRLERLHRQVDTPESKASLAEGSGCTALAEGQYDRAAECFNHAAEIWGSIQRPYDQARAVSYLGRSLAQAGNGIQARARIDQALTILHSLATQLEDPELKRSFINSSLVRHTREAHAMID